MTVALLRNMAGIAGLALLLLLSAYTKRYLLNMQKRSAKRKHS